MEKNDPYELYNSLDNLKDKIEELMSPNTTQSYILKKNLSKSYPRIIEMKTRKEIFFLYLSDLIECNYTKMNQNQLLFIQRQHVYVSIIYRLIDSIKLKKVIFESFGSLQELEYHDNVIKLLIVLVSTLAEAMITGQNEETSINYFKAIHDASDISKFLVILIYFRNIIQCYMIILNIYSPIIQKELKKI